MNKYEKNMKNDSIKRSVFISHASKNFKFADEVRSLIEAQGLTCWIAPRDIPPGGQYGTSIVEAIRDCTVVLLLLTDEANKSKPVENEIERAFNHQKTIVPIRLHEIKPSKGLEFFISNAQWVDAIVSPLKGRIDQIVNIVHAIELEKPIDPPEPEVATFFGRVERTLEQALRHKVLSVSIGFSTLILLVASVLGMQMLTQGGLQSATTSIGKSVDRIDEAANTLVQTSGTIKTLDTKLDAVKKETSDDPRKELANLGLSWDESSFADSLNDPKASSLYQQGGMRLSVSNFYRVIKFDKSIYKFLNENDVLNADCESIKTMDAEGAVLAEYLKTDNFKFDLFNKVCNKNGEFADRVKLEMIELQKQVKNNEIQKNELMKLCVERLKLISRSEWESFYIQFKTNKLALTDELERLKFDFTQSDAIVSELEWFRKIYDKRVDEYYSRFKDNHIKDRCEGSITVERTTGDKSVELDGKIRSLQHMVKVFAETKVQRTSL